METLKKKVRVIVESVIEVEITPNMFMGYTEEEYLKEFSRAFWDVNGMDDIVLFAARVAATQGRGQEDGLGKLEPAYMRRVAPDADVYFDILEEDIDSEFVDN